MLQASCYIGVFDKYCDYLGENIYFDVEYEWLNSTDSFKDHGIFCEPASAISICDKRYKKW